MPFLTRTLTPFEVLDEEGLSLIEDNADTVLQEVGLEFRGNEDALRLFREAGADVTGVRVRFPRGLARSIVQATAPRQFTQYARNPERNVEIDVVESRDHVTGNWESANDSTNLGSQRCCRRGIGAAHRARIMRFHASPP